MRQTLISIIIPSYNSGMYLEHAIQSVMDQSYANWELLIIDGGSTDCSLECALARQRSDARVKLILNPNDTGPAQARAFGINHAHGDVIAFLDADDIWLSEKLERQLRFMTDNSYDFTFTDYRTISSSGRVSSAKLSGWSENSFNQYLRRRGIANSTVMVRRECISDQVLSAIDKRLGEDTLWWLLILKSGYKAYALKEVLALYRKVPNSRSSSILENQLAVWQMYRFELNLSLMRAIFSYTGYLVDVSVRRLLFLVRVTLGRRNGS